MVHVRNRGFKNLEILLVHADRWVRANLGDQLRGSGHWVVEAPNGDSALRYLVHHHRPDVIVIGPALAEISRSELIELLRADPNTRAIPIIAAGHGLQELECSEPLASGGA